jgi:hypothetical protein
LAEPARSALEMAQEEVAAELEAGNLTEQLEVL